ncbi:uncharacterized protein [Palaemon carinicauda]|uniref:uncharacterized protein n=1 Tax=Palaemon carinicauda TaxID=392227 RepID=UPI0035B68B78
MKSETKSKRGKGSRRRVTRTRHQVIGKASFVMQATRLLFHHLAETCEAETTSAVIVTKRKDAISNIMKSLKAVSLFCQEEPDTRIFTRAEEYIPISESGSEERTRISDVECPERRGAELPVRRGTELPVKRGAERPERRGAERPERRGAERPERRGAERPVRRGAELPVRRGSEHPVRRGAELPVKRGAERPVRRGAKHPGRCGAKLPVRRGAERLTEQDAERPIRCGAKRPGVRRDSS